MKLTTNKEKKDWIKKRIGFIDGKTLTIALNRYWTNSAKKSDTIPVEQTEEFWK